MNRLIYGLIACTLLGCADATAPDRYAQPPQQIVLSVPIEVEAFSAGYYNTCAIKTDGTVACWGYDGSGQSSPPADLGTVQSVSAGRDHACAVKTNGAVTCWGSDPYSYGMMSVPSAVDGSGEAKQVSVSEGASCAIKSDDTVVCWGFDGFGQTAVPVALGTVKQVSTGPLNVCAIKTDDTLLCWGNNSNGQSTIPPAVTTVKQVETRRQHTCAIMTLGDLACWGNNQYGQTSIPEGIGPVKDIALGENSTCAIRSDDSVLCWGQNTSGQTTVPAGIGPITDITSNGAHVCAVKADLTLVCWGGNNNGQATPPLVPMTTSAGLAAGGYNSCTIQNGASIICWGRNNYGQDSPPHIGIPQQLAVGGFHSCAIKPDQTVTCWGNNTFGQLSVPGDLGAVKAVAAGHFHNCAIKVSNTLACWGYNSDGQSTVPSGFPFDFVPVSEVALGADFTCSVLNYQVWCWGANGSGQLNVPGDLGTVVHVTAGEQHACAIRTNGTVGCWGNNGSGQTTVPNDLGTVTSVVAGMDHTCALKTNGTVACWGSNTLGQTSIPAGLGSVATIAAGTNHTCAVKTDGLTTVCWGSNQYGQSTVPGQLVRYLPTATLTVPADAASGASFNIELTGAHVDLPTGTLSAADAGIQYAFDCGDGTGYGSFSSTSTVSCTAGTVGTQIVKGKVQDGSGDTQEYTDSVTVTAPETAPNSPSTVSMTSAWTPNQVLTISWTDLSTNETSFVVQRRSQREGDVWGRYATIDSVSADATSYADGTVVQSMSYQYRVSACNAAGCSAYATGGVFVAGVIPEAPQSASIAATGPGAIEFTWTDASAVDSRNEVQRSAKTTTWGKYTLVATLPADGDSYTDSGLTVGYYRYRVRACNRVGCSAWLTAPNVYADVRPAAPINAVATATSPTSVILSWFDTSSNETSFTILRRTYNGSTWSDWVRIATRPADTTNFTNGGLAPNTMYQYRVASVNAAGGSAPATSNHVTTPN